MGLNQKEKLAMVPKGGGTFVYVGGSFDVESIPGVQAKVGGRLQWTEDGKRKPIYVKGKEPKVNRKPLTTVNVRGYLFKKDEPVYVGDIKLAAKLRCLNNFVEFEKEDYLGLNPGMADKKAPKDAKPPKKAPAKKKPADEQEEAAPAA